MTTTQANSASASSAPAAPAHAVPPAQQMVQLLAGFQLSQALYAVAALGIADLLRDGPRDAAVLAGQAGADAMALRRVLRATSSPPSLAAPTRTCCR